MTEKINPQNPPTNPRKWVCRTAAVGLFWEKGEKAGKNRFLCDGLSATLTFTNETNARIFKSAVKSAVRLEQQSNFVY
jgi:hypothetical protein